MPLGRRKVLELSAVMTGAALTGLAGALAAACGSDDTGTTNPPSTNPKDGSSPSDSGNKGETSTDGSSGTDAPAGVTCRSSIMQNHGHAITIPLADLDSSTAKTYSIKGTADHDHQITLDPNDLAELKSKVSVKKTSTTGGQSHDHDVAILCT
jgi:ABC-type phosphate transport system substrate-binding protein